MFFDDSASITTNIVIIKTAIMMPIIVQYPVDPSQINSPAEIAVKRSPFQLVFLDAINILPFYLVRVS